MINIASWLLITLSSPCSLGCTTNQPTLIEDKGIITVKMEECEVSRSRSATGLLEALAGGGKDKLVRRGVVEIQGKRYTLYLPKAKSYTVENKGKRDNDFENKSTLITIDQSGAGKFSEEDNWFANLPIRLGDRMFDVVEIAANGDQIILRPSNAPLSGTLIGRTCPAFSFKTADGKIISRESLKGKAFLLDIWSIT